LAGTLALTESTGGLTTAYTYGPFGQTVVAGPVSGNPFQFSGRENDGTGLYYYRARYYHPTLARFLGEDPLGLAGGDINLYSYVANNPVNLTDPTGEAIPIIIAAAVATGAWSAVVAELGEWFRGGSPEEVGRAGARAGVGGTVGAAIALAVPTSAPVAASIGGAAGGFVESWIEQLQTGQGSLADHLVNAAAGAALGRLGEAINPTATTRVVSRYLIQEVKNLQTLHVQRLPIKLMTRVSTLDDRLRSLGPNTIATMLFREISHPSVAWGRK
jgi:RHS repeat-associated protein